MVEEIWKFFPPLFATLGLLGMFDASKMTAAEDVCDWHSAWDVMGD